MPRNYGVPYNPNYDSPANYPPGSARNEDRLIPGYRLGLLPDQGHDRLTMPFKAEASDIVVPASADHLAGVPAFNMGGNNRFGTCGPTSFSNYVAMVYWNILGLQVYSTDDAVFDLYRASGNPQFDPNTDADDNGVDMVVLLNAARDVGIEVTYTGVVNPAVIVPGQSAVPVAGATEQVKAVCFGALDNTVESLRISTAVFGGCELAVSLEVAQQAQLASGVWDYSPSGSWGGHAIMGAAYTGNPQGPDEEIITWTKPVGLTDAFVQYQLSQSFAVVLPAHLTHPPFLQGVDVQQLASDYQELTGQSFPA